MLEQEEAEQLLRVLGPLDTARLERGLALVGQGAAAEVGASEWGWVAGRVERVRGGARGKHCCCKCC